MNHVRLDRNKNTKNRAAVLRGEVSRRPFLPAKSASGQDALPDLRRAFPRSEYREGKARIVAARRRRAEIQWQAAAYL